MLKEMILRLVLGGLIVCAFSALGEVFTPKTFAGIFGAAPSVALATLGITFATHPPPYAAMEGRAMLAGGIALIGYCLLVSGLFARFRHHPIIEAGAPWLLWFGVAFGLWGAWLK